MATPSRTSPPLVGFSFCALFAAGLVSFLVLFPFSTFFRAAWSVATFFVGLSLVCPVIYFWLAGFLFFLGMCSGFKFARISSLPPALHWVQRTVLVLGLASLFFGGVAHLLAPGAGMGTSEEAVVALKDWKPARPEAGGCTGRR